MDVSRRSFFRFGLGAVLSAAVASELIRPSIPELWGDGVHDDSKALQALFDGAPVTVAGSGIRAIKGDLRGGVYSLSRPVVLTRSDFTFEDAHLFTRPEFPPNSVMLEARNVSNVTLRRLFLDNRSRQTPSIPAALRFWSP